MDEIYDDKSKNILNIIKVYIDRFKDRTYRVNRLTEDKLKFIYSFNYSTKKENYHKKVRLSSIINVCDMMQLDIGVYDKNNNLIKKLNHRYPVSLMMDVVENIAKQKYSFEKISKE